ncbi:MAG: DUF4442 domain-containing protein [Myxococcota bacterium]
MSATAWGVDVLKSIGERMPRRMRGNLIVRAFGLTKIPILGFIGPKVVELDDERCVIRIPLNWRTRNHLRVMYIGVLTAGADLAGGLMAMEVIFGLPQRVDLLFKDFKADFVRRAGHDVYFAVEQGAEIRSAVDRTIETGERQNVSVNVTCYCEAPGGREVVANVVLTLTMKKRG